ncbi:MAG: hypothetical protein DLM67_02200 [Candidatus Nephthysia bennettiae]|nr:MAG: hypothetical protein DLM67_02200 [Candidatus Dormibacteraeota bacterium]
MPRTAGSRGRIRRDEAGGVVGSAGLSVIPDRHEIELGPSRPKTGRRDVQAQFVTALTVAPLLP